MLSFKEWMREVNRHINKTVGLGLGVSDLSDQPFYEWWEDGVEPREAAEITLEDNGWAFQ